MSDSVQNTTKLKASKWNLVSWKTLYLLLIAGIFFGSYAKVYDSKLGLMGDNVSYLSLGKSLADGNGYKMQHLVQNSQEVSIPILYPLIVSSVIKRDSAIIENVGVVKKLNGFFFLGFLIVAFLLFSKLGNNEHISFLVICVLLFNTHLLRYSFVSMSEMSFVFWIFLSLLFFTKVDFNLSPFKSIHFWLSILFLLLSYHTRALGLSLFGGYMVYFVLTKKWHFLMTLVITFFVLVIPWHYYVSTSGDSLHFNQIMMVNPYQPELGHMSSMSDWTTRILENFIRYMSVEFSSALTGVNVNYSGVNLPGTFSLSNFVVGLGIVLIAILGMFSIPRFKTLVFGFFVGTMVVVLCWPPAWYGTRFIIAFIPVLIFFFVVGVNRIFSYVIEKTKKKQFENFPYSVHFGALTTVFLVGFSMSGYSELAKLANDDYPVKYKNYFRVAVWVKENVEKDAVISCRKPGLFYVFSDRKVSGFLNDADVYNVKARLVSDSIDYVVLDGLGFTSTSKYLYPVTEFYQGKFANRFNVGAGGDVKDPLNSLYQFDDSKGYAGSYTLDKKSGNGRFDYWDGSYYIGGWDNDFKSGYGEFYWADGKVFKGQWQDNKRNGQGFLKIGDAYEYIGYWENDMMQGEFEVKDFEKGIYYNAYFEDDQMIIK